jgi:GGDEF domain-containing protein
MILPQALLAALPMNLDGFIQLIFNVYEAFTVALYVPEQDRLRCLSFYSFAASFDKGKTIPIEGTLAGWVVKHREALIVGNFDKDEETLGYYDKKEEIKSFMAYPLESPGVIVVDSKKKWVFTDKEKKILTHFVSMLSREVERDKELHAMEEEREELILTRRLISITRRPDSEVSSISAILEEGIMASGADLAVIGMEMRGGLKVVGAAGSEAPRLMGMDCEKTGSIVSTVIEGGDEFLLPFESGFLREKPFLAHNDGIRPRQYFGFPLFLHEKVYGFAGFASLSTRHLQEKSIGLLRDTATLISLFLARFKVRDDIEVHTDADPVTGALRFGPFFVKAFEMMKKGNDFALVCLNLYNFDHYNRTLGIDYTDDLLRTMYQAIEYCMGRNAIITRSGKGRYYVALPGGDVPERENVLNILKFTVLSRIADEIKVVTKNVVEIGVSYFPRDGDDLWILMDMAKDRGSRYNG